MKLNVAVIYGGPGSEHEISILSGESIVQSLDVQKYEIQKIFIQKDMKCVIDGSTKDLTEVLDNLSKDTIIIPILHGAYGEGGKFQKLLEDRNLKYLWSDSNVSSLVMDKYKTEKVLRENSLNVPSSIIVNNAEDEIMLPFPLIVKPRDEGSSVDLYKVTNNEDLRVILKETLSKHVGMLAQECIIGREFTCGVVEMKNDLTPLVPTEIILTKGELFDYKAKYTVGGCIETTPAEVPDEVTHALQHVAMSAHKALGCRDISRTDMIMRDDGTIVVLEVNTIPGMTKTSFVPAQALASGYTLGEILDIVISNHI